MADLQKYKPLLHDNPLCGIDTYKDTLNLATGACVRNIKKIVLTGEESGWAMSGTGLFYNLTLPDNPKEISAVVSTHFIAETDPGYVNIGHTRFGGTVQNPTQPLVFNYDNGAIGLTAFKQWLANQYDAGTPVTVWYVLATPTSETIIVPSGLSGTEEGYLTQSETPTPTNPVYPTANEVLIWQHSLRKLGTATETIQSGDTIYADGTAATLSLKGNEQHTGTPSPSNPVDANGVGERTENLFPATTNWYRNNSSDPSRTEDIQDTRIKSDIVPISGDGETISVATFNMPDISGLALLALRFFDSAKTEISSGLPPIAIPVGAKYISLLYGTATGGITDATKSQMQSAQIMVVYGNSIPTSYEPYGYKIPISNGQQTTNIYLGSVPLDKNGTAVDTIEDNTLYKVTNRSVLTGSENWTLQSINQYGMANFYLANVLTGLDISKGILCSHGERQTTGISQTTTEGFLANNNGEIYFRINSTTASTVSEFQSWLSGQNPQVTFLYTLATPTSTTVTAPSIPTTDGANTITVDTTVKPSEVTATYTGWHDASVKEKSENLMTFATATTISDNGITVTSDGQGIYHVEGTASADTNLSLTIPEFTIPVCVGSGGQGTMALFNGQIGRAQGDSRLEFYNGSTKIDGWQLIQANRTSTTYGSLMDGKTCNKINIFIKSGVSVNADVKPMFTDDSQLPSTYAPYWE
jgi:hypothetical protein